MILASWWHFQYDRKGVFACIYVTQIIISSPPLFSASFSGTRVKNRPKNWTWPLSLTETSEMNLLCKYIYKHKCKQCIQCNCRGPPAAQCSRSSTWPRCRCISPRRVGAWCARLQRHSFRIFCPSRSSGGGLGPSRSGTEWHYAAHTCSVVWTRDVPCCWWRCWWLLASVPH